MNKDNIIYSYTRTQAIEDGVLVDVSKIAAEAGFKVPVAMTSTVHGKYVQVPPSADWQDETGRLWIFSRCFGMPFGYAPRNKRGFSSHSRSTTGTVPEKSP